MKKTFTALLVLICFLGKSQSDPKSGSKPIRNMLEGHKNAFEVGIGSLGVTAEFQHRFAKHFAYRLGGTFLPGVKGQDVTTL